MAQAQVVETITPAAEKVADQPEARVLREFRATQDHRPQVVHIGQLVEETVLVAVDVVEIDSVEASAAVALKDQEGLDGQMKHLAAYGLLGLAETAVTQEAAEAATGVALEADPILTEEQVAAEAVT